MNNPVGTGPINIVENQESKLNNKIDPTPYRQDPVYMVFIYSISKTLKPILNTIASRHGAYVINYNNSADSESFGDTEEDIKQEKAHMMGYIEEATFVVLGNEGNTCDVGEFISKYANEKGIPVLTIPIPPKTKEKDIKQEEINTRYETFVRSNEASFSNKRYVLSLNSTESDRLLRIMSTCIQEQFRTRTVGQYIIESREMVNTMGGNEIHIITNEIPHYDFNPIASLAIAINTQKQEGVHYYYYVTENHVSKITNLKDRVRQYYSQTLEVRKSVLSWIRSTMSKQYDYKDFFDDIKRSSIRGIIEELFNVDNDATRRNMCERICEALSIQNAITHAFGRMNMDNINDWLSGIENQTDIGTMYNNIDKICALLSAFDDETNNEILNNSVIREFRDKLELLKHLKMLTIWYTDDSSSDRVTSLERDDIIGILRTIYAGINAPRPMQEWLEKQCQDNAPKGSRELDVDKDTINRYLSNIHCFTIDDDPYTLCYNFALFLCRDGRSITDAAWYTTCEKRYLNSLDNVDNDLIMIGFNKGTTVYNEIMECYVNIVKKNPEIMEELKKNHSMLYKKIYPDLRK